MEKYTAKSCLSVHGFTELKALREKDHLKNILGVEKPCREKYMKKKTLLRPLSSTRGYQEFD